VREGVIQAPDDRQLNRIVAENRRLAREFFCPIGDQARYRNRGCSDQNASGKDAS